MKSAIGVDIGGTSIKLGLVTGGKVTARDSFLTPKTQSREATIRELAVRVSRLAAGRRIAGVGIGAPGPIDVERGLVYFFPNIPGWKNTPLRTLLQKSLGLKVQLDNDANAMAFGEALFGAGRGAKNVIALTLGTGVGGGIVMDGKLFHGHSFSAAEIGHLVLNEHGPLCGCGMNGCLETYVGNGYFATEVKRRLARGSAKGVLARWLREGKTLSPYLVWQAAQKGDPLAKGMWEDTGVHLGTALAGLVNILNPEKIILGGGIAQDKKAFLAVVSRTIKKKAFPIAARSVTVVPAALGTDAGLVGAAALAFAD